MFCWAKKQIGLEITGREPAVARHSIRTGGAWHAASEILNFIFNDLELTLPTTIIKLISKEKIPNTVEGYSYNVAVLYNKN